VQLKIDYEFDKEEKKKDGTPKTHKKDKVDYEIKFTKIVEFTPTEDKPHYDHTQEIKRELKLDTWKDMVITETDIEDERRLGEDKTPEEEKEEKEEKVDEEIKDQQKSGIEVSE